VVQIKTSLRARQNDGVRTISEEDCAQRETTGVFGHDPDNLHKHHRVELKEMASRCIACSRVPSYSYCASLVVAGTKFDALSN
jgi:hypothetical protein